MRAEELLERFGAVLDALHKPAIPLESQLWDHADVSAYLKRHPRTVRESITCLPSFPKAIRLPTKDNKAQPLYNAQEVIDWAMRQKEKH